MPDIGFSSAIILEQFPSGKKAIEEVMCKTENSGRDQCCRGCVSLFVTILWILLDWILAYLPNILPGRAEEPLPPGKMQRTGIR